LPRRAFEDQWTQVETGSAITWKYPSCVLRGDDSSGEFYSIAVTNGRQQADTGTKMIHLGKNTRSRIISKGISAGKSSNTYRGLVSAHAKAVGRAQFHTMRLAADRRSVRRTHRALHRNRTPDAQFEHEATTTKLSDDQLFYLRSRGIPEEEAVALLVNGFVREVLQKLPMEFAVEAQKLLEVSLEGSVG
jgi:Fe-S cluster assembly protein SufB